MKNENNQQCEPCEQQFENNVDKIVNEVEGYTPSDRKARQKEVDGAFGNKAQGQNYEKGQSYGTGTKMQGQDEQWKQNGQKDGQQQYGSGQTAGAATQGQSGQWKENTSSNDKPYGNNGRTGSANGHSYGNPTDRHEHAKEGEEAYAGKHK